MAVEAVFFDIGGVLVHADLEIYADVGARLFASTAEDMRAAVRLRVPELETGRVDSATFWKQVGETLWRSGKGRPAEPGVCQGLWKRLLADCARYDLHVMHLVGELKKRPALIVGALSNTIEEHVEHLTQMGMYQPFQPVVLSCRVGCRKPEPEIYRLAAQEAQIGIKRCLLIDDLPDNLTGARAAGMQTHHFTGLAQLRADLKRLKVL